MEGLPPDSSGPMETMTASPQVRPRPDRSIVPEQFTAIHIEVVGGPMDGVTAHRADNSVTIGRSASCDLPLPLDPMVSTHHARIVREDGSFWLEDLDSRNGTFLGEQQVQGRVPLAPGALFVLGSTCLEFVPA